jgi:polyisoprenoid-binding protein YceI
VRLHATVASPTRPLSTLAVNMTLHGVTRRLTVPVRLQVHGSRLVASGSFVLRQSDFGITPYRALGGALRVRDRIDLQFTLRGTRIASDEIPGKR